MKKKLTIGRETIRVLKAGILRAAKGGVWKASDDNQTCFQSCAGGCTGSCRGGCGDPTGQGN